jgi:peptide/nickel transport system substrate-binding protein
MKTNYKSVLASLMVLVAVLSTSGCGLGGDRGTILVGQTGVIEQIDPAAVYSTDSQTFVFQAFGSLFNAVPGSADLLPDLAASGSYRTPLLYEVVLKPELRFSNGNALTASDVKHSIDRVRDIGAPINPSILLANIGEITVEEDLVLTIELLLANDQTIRAVLSSVAGLIVDEEVFPADRTLSPEEVIEGNSFSGPYRFTSFVAGSLISYEANPSFSGIWGAPRNSEVIVKFYEDPNNLALDAGAEELDVVFVWRSLPPRAVLGILDTTELEIEKSQGAVPILLSFRVDMQPFGTKQDNADAKKALAIRAAMAHLIDRKPLLRASYGQAAQPSYSYIPIGLPGAAPVLQSLYGDGRGGPSLEKATEALAEAGVSAPVKIRLMFSPERYGPMSEALVSTLKDQVEKDGLFELEVSTSEWSALREIRVAETTEHDLFLLHWGPDFADSDNYLAPVFRSTGWLATGFVDETLDQKIAESASITEPFTRELALKEVQEIIAENLPAIVLGMDGRSALVKPGVSGIGEALDVTFKIKFGYLSKSE